MAETIIRVSTDVGGTFTDLVYFETDAATGVQTVRTAKSDTTPPDFEKGVLNVLDVGKVDVGKVDMFAHGTTVVINALTERKGAKVGLITTRGFRDSIEIGRGNRPDFFNLMYKKPPPFVPRYLRHEVGGRMDYQGNEVAPLDLATLDETLALFRADGVEAVAICLLPWSPRTRSPASGANTSAPTPPSCRPMCSPRRSATSKSSRPA
jgi:N-methylhydantoinase A